MPGADRLAAVILNEGSLHGPFFVAETGIALPVGLLSALPSKHNPIERRWARLEQYWNGDLLDSVAAVMAFAGSMKWKGQHPTLELLTKTYKTDVRLSQKAMAALETKARRLPGLEK